MSSKVASVVVVVVVDVKLVIDISINRLPPNSHDRYTLFGSYGMRIGQVLMTIYMPLSSETESLP